MARRLHRLRRRTLTRALVQAHEVEDGHSVHLATFTYRPGVEWTPRHITETVGWYRRYAHRHGVELRYEWVAELQLKRLRRYREGSRACMHYHALIWAPPGFDYPYPDESGWWPHGMTQVEVAYSPVGYLTKYASKGTAGEPLPRGVRISGGGGISAQGRLEVAWWMLPRYVRDWQQDHSVRVVRARGGGWLNTETGEVLPARVWDGQQWGEAKA